MKNPEITRVLDASTGHITRDDSVRLENGETAATYTLDEYGWLVYVGELGGDEANYPGFSQAFLDLIADCRANDCAYLRLDRDGPVYEDVPRFDW